MNTRIKKESIFKFPQHTFPFIYNQRSLLCFEKTLKPSVWINKYFYLPKSYSSPGKLTLFKFQEKMVDSITEYETVCFIGPVQTGKSVCAEACISWLIRYTKENMMFIYELDKKLPAIFKERLEPLIRENKDLHKFISDDPDDFTKDKISLRHIIIRPAGAGVGAKKAISTFSAGVIYGDEVAKWPNIEGFSQLKALDGRTKAVKMSNRKIYKIYCTSPVDELDKSYLLCHDLNADFYRLYFTCPHCMEKIQFLPENIEELPNDKGTLDHDPERIEHNESAVYRCSECYKEITEDQRKYIILNPEWKTVNCFDKTKIIDKKDNAVKCIFNWNRLAIPTYGFHHMLADYYRAEQSADIQMKQTHLNEDCADWKRIKDDALDTRYLANLTKKYSYDEFMLHDVDSRAPDFMYTLIAGIDVQDSGFYVSIRGLGLHGESGMLCSFFIPCSINDEQFKEKSNILKIFDTVFVKKKFKTQNGRNLHFLFGLIDRGGHRPKDIDYLTTRIPWLWAYIGNPRGTKADIIEWRGSWYYGDTKRFSSIFGSKLQSKIFHLPKNFSKEYGEQVVRQYWDIYKDARGRIKSTWVSGGDDHYRDCENLIEAAIFLNDIDEISQHEDMYTRNIMKKTGKSLYDEPNIDRTKSISPHKPIENTKEKPKARVVEGFTNGVGIGKEEKKTRFIDIMKSYGW